MKLSLFRDPRSPRRKGFAVLALSFALLASACDGESSSESSPSAVAPASAASCGNGAVEAGEQCDDGNNASGDGCSQSCQTESASGPSCGNGDVEPGEQCDDGNTVSGDGCSQSCQSEIVSGAIEVRNIRSVADVAEGATITMSNYTAPADGLLVVRIGAKGSVSESVMFDGVDMIHVSSLEVSYSTSISVEMYYLPVAAGESGAIEVDYGFTGTDGKAIIAATLLGVDRLERVQTFTDGETFSEGRSGPNLAEYSLSTSNESVILSVLTDHGRGIPAETGLGHLLDAHPTVPEAVFHETKVMAGHVTAPLPGDYSLGYRNTDPLGYMDYVMIVAAFSQSD